MWGLIVFGKRSSLEESDPKVRELRADQGRGVVKSVPEAPVVGTKKSNDLEKVTIKELTERHRMIVEEGRELPFSCTQCGRHISQPRYIQRHKCVTTRKKG